MVKQTIVERFNQLELQMLVHSLLYYGMNKNIISDNFFDHIMYEFVDMKNKYPEELKQSSHYEDFADFEGATGCNLRYDTPEIRNIVRKLLRNLKWKNIGLGLQQRTIFKPI